jgi:hypothetical protein
MRQKSTELLPGARSRLPDWETRLHDWASRQIGLPFVLGSTNCSMLAVKAIDVMYDTTFFFEFAAVAADDAAELAEAADRRTLREFKAHGFTPVAVNFEQTGDVLIGWKEPFERCAVYLGGGRCLTSSRSRGVAIVPLAVFRRAYNAEAFRWA